MYRGHKIACIVDRVCQELCRLVHVTATIDDEIAEEKGNSGKVSALNACRVQWSVCLILFWQFNCSGEGKKQSAREEEMLKGVKESGRKRGIEN